MSIINVKVYKELQYVELVDDKLVINGQPAKPEQIKQVFNRKQIKEFIARCEQEFNTNAFNQGHSVEKRADILYVLDEIKDTIVIKRKPRTNLKTDLSDLRRSIKYRSLSQRQPTQEDLTRLFKVVTNDDDRVYVIRHMSVETAAALLTVETKNVASKMIDEDGHVTKALKAIVDKVEQNHNPEAFNLLREFFTNNNVCHLPQHPWNMLEKYAGQYTVEELAHWIKNSGVSGMSVHEFNDTFFQDVLMKLPEEQKYKLHPAITNAFVSRMSEEEKKEFITSYVNVPKVLKRMGQADTQFATLSSDAEAAAFEKLTYEEKIAFVIDDNRPVRCWKEMIPEIIERKDAAAARVILQSGVELSDDTQRELAVLFDLNTRIEIMTNFESTYRRRLKNFIRPYEMETFAAVAVTEQSLHDYVDELDASVLNKAVHESTKPLSGVQIDYYAGEKLDKESILKLLPQVDLNKSHADYVGKLFRKLNRQEIENLIGPAITRHSLVNYLAHVMTEYELINKCNDPTDEYDFLRVNVNLAPQSYLLTLTKKEIKKIAGNCRRHNNRSFRDRLEAAVKKAKDKKKGIVDPDAE